MSGIELKALTVRRGPSPVIEDVTLSIAPGELVGLIGPNGAGKTTLMRGALGLLPFEGRSSLADLTPRERACQAAWLPQEREIAWPVTVETLVTLGRTPYLAGGRRLSPSDRVAIDAALSRMGLEALRNRVASELSGGEIARSLIARALAQNTPVILADEPVAGLDPAHQMTAMKVFRNLADEGRTILVSLHDLALASRYCGRLLLLDRGRLVADGSPAEVLNDARMRAVFDVGGEWVETARGPVFHAFEGEDA